MSADLYVEMSGGFSVRQGRLERMIRLLAPVMTLEEETNITIDLRRLVSVSPAALALLIATLKRVGDLNLLGENSRVLAPVSRPVNNYLLRMNLLRVLLGAEDYNPEDWETDRFPPPRARWLPAMRAFHRAARLCGRRRNADRRPHGAMRNRSNRQSVDTDRA